MSGLSSLNEMLGLRTRHVMEEVVQDLRGSEESAVRKKGKQRGFYHFGHCWGPPGLHPSGNTQGATQNITWIVPQGKGRVDMGSVIPVPLSEGLPGTTGHSSRLPLPAGCTDSLGFLKISVAEKLRHKVCLCRSFGKGRTGFPWPR
jgi:hypothetical protein